MVVGEGTWICFRLNIKELVQSVCNKEDGLFEKEQRI